DVIPVQFPGLLGTDADSQAQHHVGVQPGLPRRLEQREGLRQGKRPARPPDLARGVVDQRGHVPADQVVRLGIPDRPGEGSPGHLQVPGRHFAAERLEPSAHIAGRQLPQRLEADVLQQRLERLTVDGPRALRPPRRPPSSQSSTACRTVYVAEVWRPRSSSLWTALSLSRTSALVRPETLRRTRLPSEPKPTEIAPT